MLTEPERALRKRDMAVLGTVGGLILGWMTANAAEHARNGGVSRNARGASPSSTRAGMACGP